MPSCIWEFDTLEDEVSFLADSICELIKKGISLQQIKICGAHDEYQNTIKRIFAWYHIPVLLNEHTLYQTKIGLDFLKNLTDQKEENLKYLEEHYSLNNPVHLDIYRRIIKILNQYTWCPSLVKVKDFIKNDFQKENLNLTENTIGIGFIQTLAEANCDEYIFLVGFNQGEIPRTIKDEDYFNDTLKEKLGLETTKELNYNNYSKWLEDISHLKNLIISTKKMSSSGVCYISSLNDDLQLKINHSKPNYQNSELHNQLKLAEKIDLLVKYNEIDSDLGKLYHHYPDFPYATFQSNYTQIDPEKIKQYINNQLTLSYSTLNTYYQCSFRYYLANVLKLNIYEETFYTILGNLFHYVLSVCFKENFNLEKEYKAYLEKCTYQFNSREKYFLDTLKKELEFIIKTIKEQQNTSTLTKLFLEQRVEVDQSRLDMKITFKGFIDKIMYNEDKNLIAIIDYKTGSPDLNLNHIIYGLDLQLPIYIYLAKHKYPSARIAGFYLQKILNTEIICDHKHTYEALKQEKLKLQGYSNSNVEVLEQFDSSYNESKVIKGMRTTSKGVASKKVLDDEKIEKLEQIVKEKIEEAISGILSANFEINPKRIEMNNLGCEFCQFKDICFMSEKNIQNLKEYKNMEFLGGDDNDPNETSE